MDAQSGINRGAEKLDAVFSPVHDECQPRSSGSGCAVINLTRCYAGRLSGVTVFAGPAQGRQAVRRILMNEFSRLCESKIIARR